MMRVALRMAVSAPAKALYGLYRDVKHRLKCYALLCLYRGYHENVHGK